LRILARDRHHDLMQRYLCRGQSQSMPAFGGCDASLQAFAKHTRGRPTWLWDWIDQLGEDESRPKLRAHSATKRGREMRRDIRERIQRAV
jgi:hypothetical protein